MRGGRLIAEFEHIAHRDHQTGAESVGNLARGRERGANRARIRVVGVVDYEDAVNRSAGEAAGDRLHAGERVGDGSELARFERCRAHRGGAGDRGGTVERGGFAQQRDFSFDEGFDLGGDQFPREFDADARAGAHAATDEPHVSVDRFAECDSAQMFRNPRQHHRLVGRRDRILRGS